jgi:hypothetical protein
MASRVDCVPSFSRIHQWTTGLCMKCVLRGLPKRLIYLSLMNLQRKSGSSNLQVKSIINSSPLNSSWFVDNPPPPLYALPDRSDSRQTRREGQTPPPIHVPQIKTYHSQASYSHSYGTRSSSKHLDPEIPRSVPSMRHASDITALTDKTSKMTLNGVLAHPSPTTGGAIRSMSRRSRRKPYDPFTTILGEEMVRPVHTVASEALKEAKKAKRAWQQKENAQPRVVRSRKKSIA